MIVIGVFAIAAGLIHLWATDMVMTVHEMNADKVASFWRALDDDKKAEEEVAGAKE
jgi:hypothetical protein